jgi:hypothetical protein
LRDVFEAAAPGGIPVAAAGAVDEDVYPAEAGSDVLDQAGGAAEAVRSNGKAAARAPVLSMSLARLRPAASSVR